MSGHNKWSTIKHKKGRADAARGKLFTRLIREIVVATREGGKDADFNPRLRAAINTASGSNMPKDTIERAILRGAGELEGAEYVESTYEGYGPGGVAFFLETMTDNKNRTVAEVRHAFAKNGGNLGTDGSVAWMFERKGLIQISPRIAFETLFEAAVEAGAEDVERGVVDPDDPEDDVPHNVYCEFTDLNAVATELGKQFDLVSAKPTRITTNPMDVAGKLAAQTMRLYEVLDELDDVQDIYMNAVIDDDELEALSS